MPRPAKPWKRKQDNCWYATIDGKKVKLTEPGESYGAAVRRFHEEKAKSKPDQKRSGPLTVAQVLDDFLEWCLNNRAERTYEWYRDYLVRFINRHGTRGLVANLKPHHVQKWVAADYSGCSNNCQRGAIRATQRAMNWAVTSDYIGGNAVRGMEKPPQESRETFITQKQFDVLIERSTDQEIKDYLTFMWETGCRSQEIKLIQAQHFRDGVITLERVNSKGKKYPRVIFLNQRAKSIVQRLSKQHPSGPLFRNSKGTAWTSSSLRRRFERFKKIIGEPNLCSTVLRHSWATDVLTNGMDTTTASILMGHRDPSTLARNYQHLTQKRKYLQDAADSARSVGSPKS